MNTVSLLTPPMDESEPLPEERHPGNFKKWLELPLLTNYELERIRTLSSLSFDEFHVQNPADLTYQVRLFFAKARQYLVRYVDEMKSIYKTHKYKTIERRIFYGLAKQCHVVLLANDWTGALELYQEVLSHHPDLFSHDPSMYFGLGLVYLHFKQWKPAIEAFTRLLYSFPTGMIALQAKVRLGVCYMELEDYNRCINLFKLAVNDSDESVFMPKFTIKYNIALSHENNDELEIAESEYENLITELTQHISFLQSKSNVDQQQVDLLISVKAACLRQIGWISYRRSYKDDANRLDHLKKAQENLISAHDTDPRDGQSYYYLGRVYGEHEPSAHDAFVNYRFSIDKKEQNADTWCSIGALYQRQNQPIDALQAFICAIELNSTHSAAWTDLGELYEKNAQYQDALECFKNAMLNNPVAPEPIKARVQFLEKELSMPVPARPSNHASSSTFETVIPSLKEAYEQPIPLELRNRQDAAYADREAQYDNAFWDLWEDFRTMEHEKPEDMEWDVTYPRPMEDLEIQVMQLLRANEPALVKAEREVLECLETSEAVFKAKVIEYVIPEAVREMPRVTEEMIQNLRDHGHLLESPRCYSFPFLPKISFNDLPDSFSLLSELYVSMDISAQEIMQMVHRRTQPNSTYLPVFEEFAKLPEPPRGPVKPIVTDEDVRTALERSEKHPLILKTPILTVDNRKEAQSLELQRFLDGSTISCIRGLTGCLRLDLSLFSTKAVAEIDGNQEIEIRTQYQLPPETNCDHASQQTWQCVSDPSYTTVNKYAEYQSESFKHTLKGEAEKIKKNVGGTRGPSPKRMKLYKRASSPPKHLKSIKYGTNIDLSDDTKWGKQINELSKLPAFCRLIAGSNMLSHLGHQVHGMNTVKLFMKVPGCRTPAHQDSNHMASININIGPGDCEWFAVPYEYWGKMHKLCEKNGVDLLTGTFWPIIDDLLDAGIPVHRFTQKAGDMVYVSGGAIHWVQASGWCNNISWNVAPLNFQQLSISLLSYEYNKLRRFKSEVPMQLMCWQVAKNVKFTNQLIYNTCKGVLIRSLAFLRMVADYIVSQKKTIKAHTRTSGEQSHFCMTCECEVFCILFVKDIGGKFTVFCVYCAKSQGIEGFIALQQFSFTDLYSIYDNMKYIPAANNNKMSFTA
ncbi:JmjC domain-containing protein [Caenorhabditis elegans]|uniref:JmjC domain-containing protein n=1 Tax=Caenorhabditis elegans TaxID=6239 RepID=A0A131MCP7_CAEEL|nr:JmjC domain-containing protein [Caenorhabditis elegans]CZR14612.1 JmjC domain-containing protein [Caenorhabditis elegans]|eukprot:NP_001309686.1 human UTX (Ubiquitously transcribed TPR on X) homolog [Caenorhabditis elegans]